MALDDMALLQHLKALEAELHGPVARDDEERLTTLLHDDFLEFGRSGRVYRKADIMSLLLSAGQHATVMADRFELKRLSDDVALLTYRSAHLISDGTLDRFSLRSSIWQRTAGGWQMSFHQGTPTT